MPIRERQSRSPIRERAIRERPAAKLPILDEQHPDVGMGLRALISNIGMNAGPRVVSSKLAESGLVTENDPGGYYRVRKPEEKEWRYVDPPRFEAMDDLTDLLADFLVRGPATTLGAAKGAVLGAAGGPAAPVTVPAGFVAGGAAGNAVAEAGLQGLGKLLGLDPTLGEVGGTTGRAAIEGAIAAPLGKAIEWGGGKVVQGAKALGGKLASRAFPATREMVQDKLGDLPIEAMRYEARKAGAEPALSAKTMTQMLDEWQRGGADATEGILKEKAKLLEGITEAHPAFKHLARGREESVAKDVASYGDDAFKMTVREGADASVPISLREMAVTTKKPETKSVEEFLERYQGLPARQASERIVKGGPQEASHIAEMASLKRPDIRPSAAIDAMAREYGYKDAYLLSRESLEDQVERLAEIAGDLAEGPGGAISPKRYEHLATQLGIRIPTIPQAAGQAIRTEKSATATVKGALIRAIDDAGIDPSDMGIPQLASKAQKSRVGRDVAAGSKKAYGTPEPDVHPLPDPPDFQKVAYIQKMTSSPRIEYDVPSGPLGYKDIARQLGIEDVVSSADELAAIEAKAQSGYASGLGRGYTDKAKGTTTVHEPALTEGLSMAERRTGPTTFEVGWRAPRSRFLSALTSPSGAVRDLSKLAPAEKLGLGLIRAGELAGGPAKAAGQLAETVSKIPGSFTSRVVGGLGKLSANYGMSRSVERGLSAAGRALLRNPQSGFARLIASDAPAAVKSAARPVVELLKAGKTQEAQVLALLLVQQGPVAEWIKGDDGD